jgi:glycosyltransferase involved in cell wall biosynthesis
MKCSVIIPTIRGREKLLDRALSSVKAQDFTDFEVLVEMDDRGDGPAVVRNRAANRATGDFLALLDDDDEFKPGHLTKCIRHAEETGADIVYPWFDLMRGKVLRNDTKVLLQQDGNGGKVDAFEKPFSVNALRKNNYIPVTTVIRTDKFLEVGGFPTPGTDAWPHKDCEDWGLWLRMVEDGATFSHLPERTWTWWWHGRNTSGRPDNARKIYGQA